MAQKSEYSDQELIKLLHSNSDSAIDLIFRAYYKELCQMLYRIIPDKNLIEDLAQDVFFELWRKREKLHIQSSLRAYLKRAARNKALNYIRDQRMKFEDEENHPQTSTLVNSLQELEQKDLQSIINNTIDGLPERCRVIFTLSRYEEMTYQEIATELNISPKTVEHQISKALKILREAVALYQDQ